MPVHHQHPPRSKQWSLGVILPAVGGVVLAVLLMYVSLQVALGKPPVQPSGQVVRQELTHNLDISYPVLKAGKVDESLKAFAQSQADEFAAKVGASYDPRNKLTLEFHLSHYGERTLSVIFDQTEEVVGQKPLAKQYLLNFDVASGKRLSLGDIFRRNVDARGMLATVLHDYFRYDQPNTLDASQLAAVKAMPLDTVRDFLLYEDTVVFYLNPKDPANTGAVVPIAIKKSVLAPILREPYASVDKARQPDTAPKPAYTISTLPTSPPPPPVVAPGSNGGRIALTFDDGPSVHTNRLLDALAQHQARATFFVLGHLADDFSGELQRMVRDGHEIGNHTWLHPDLTALGGSQLDHEIGNTQQVIQQVTGYTPRTLRPPYGATNDTVAAYAAKWGLHVITWNVDTNDWQTHSAQAVYDYMMNTASDGRVILLHDIYGTSVDAAIRAIADLKSRGFQLVTVSEIYGL